MRQRLRLRLVAFACFAAAGLVGITAIADHHWKNVRGDRAEIAEWYCQHQGIRCGGASSAGIEARWNQRERVYVIVVSVLGAAGIVLLGAEGVRSLR